MSAFLIMIPICERLMPVFVCAHLVTCSCTLSAFCCMASRMAAEASWCFCLLSIARSSSFSICFFLSSGYGAATWGNDRTPATILRRWISPYKHEWLKQRENRKPIWCDVDFKLTSICGSNRNSFKSSFEALAICETQQVHRSRFKEWTVCDM